MKIGVIAEGKTPPDERVTLTPNQVVQIRKDHPEINIVVQSSSVRRIKDDEYKSVGIEVVENVNDCDVLIGVKEVPIPQLIESKRYFFFSHTIKMQPYNKPLLQAVMDAKVTLVDWECLTDQRGNRLIGFGRYAGIVGTYNGLRSIGLKQGMFSLKKATECTDRMELEVELKKVKLDPIKILLTGQGKVARGSIEILEALNIRKVNVKEYLSESFDEPVFCQITFRDYFKRADGLEFDTQAFLNDSSNHLSDFMRFASKTDFYIAGHYWDSSAPFLFTRQDAKRDEFRIRYIADISCDIDGPVASTLRPSTIEDPLYGYDPISETEVDYKDTKAICVMAVDNLPCELPRDASHDFGEMFINSVLPSLLNGDKDSVLHRATIVQEGELTEAFDYLDSWVGA